ncbi:hypothetical protein Tco_1237940 [Tanacetum coccineum]
MSTQQDIYAAGSENHPSMLNKENYVPWSSRLLCYAKSRPNGKLIYNSIMNGPYVRRMIPEPGDPVRTVPIPVMFHEQTDDELTEAEIKQMEADDQAIQTILLGLPKDIYVAVDSCETAQEIWLRVQQMMKGSDIGIQEKKAKLFNEWERFTSTDRESIESYYHRFSKLMNDFKRKKTTLPRKECQNLKFLNNNTTTMEQIAQPGMNLGQDNQMQMVGGNGGIILDSMLGRMEGIRNGTVRPRRRDVAYLQTQLLIAQKEEAGIQLQAEEFDLMAAVADLDEIEEVNANCILMANLQQASTSGTQSDNAPVYEIDGPAEQYIELLEPIPEPHQVLENDSNVISKVSSVEQGGGTVEQHSANVEETHAYHESLFHNLAAEVEKVNSVNQKIKEKNAELTTELARYKNQERCFEISQEKYDKLERCYQQSVYQEKCLSKKINALYLSSGKQITALNEEISNLNKQLSKEKSTVSSLQEEKKRLKSDFKIREDELLDKQIQLENKVKELDNILIKTEVDESLAKHKALELEIERLLRAVVIQDIMSIVQNNSVVDTSNLQTKLERTKERFKNYIIQKENEYAKLWNDCSVGDQKGISKDTPCVSDTLDPLPPKLENENVELEFQVSEQKDTTCGTSANTKFAKQSILGIPPSSSRPKLYAVTPLPKSTAIPKVGETNALSNQVTSNSVPSSQELKVVKNDNVIAPGMFRIDPHKTSRKDNFVPNKPTNVSVRTNPITVSQPHVIIKKAINYDSNGFSSTGVDITTKTRRPQPRSNTKIDRVPSASKSSRIMNKEVKVEDHPRNLLLSKNKKHISSECNNIKLSIRNDKSKIVCAMYKQCLITVIVNHDVCVLNYVNDMNSRALNKNSMFQMLKSKET